MRSDPRLDALAPRWNTIFWDARPEDVDPDQHADHVIARILALGDLDQARWLLHTYGEERIRDYIVQKGSYQLTPAIFRFWTVVLDVKVEGCTKKSSLPSRRPFFKP